MAESMPPVIVVNVAEGSRYCAGASGAVVAAVAERRGMRRSLAGM